MCTSGRKAQNAPSGLSSRHKSFFAHKLGSGSRKIQERPNENPSLSIIKQKERRSTCVSINYVGSLTAIARSLLHLPKTSLIARHVASGLIPSESNQTHKRTQALTQVRKYLPSTAIIIDCSQMGKRRIITVNRRLTLLFLRIRLTLNNIVTFIGTF